MSESVRKLPSIKIIGGSYRSFTFDVGTYDASTSTATLTITDYINPNNAPVLTKACSISGAESNIVTVALLPIETISLYGKYIYQISIVSDGGSGEPLQGLITITKNNNPV